jgi:RecA/RadA recombinase
MEMPANQQNMVLAGFLADAAFTRQSVELVDKCNMFADSMTRQCIWEIIRDTLQHTGQLPNQPILTTEFPEYMMEREASEIDIQTGMHLARAIAQMSQDPQVKEAIPWMKTRIRDYQSWLRNRRVASFVADNATNLQACDEAILEAHRESTRNPYKSIEEECIFDNLSYYTSTARRQATGLCFIDKLLGGGLQMGELMAILAPSGGGKTTFAVQISAEMVKRAKHVIYLSTEQQLRGDLATRMLVLATAMERDDFTSAFEDYPEELKQRVMACEGVWRKYFHFIDCGGERFDENGQKIKEDLSNTDELMQLVAQCRKKFKDEGVGLVILDWWGSLKNQMIRANADKLYNETAIRRSSQQWLQRLSVYVQEMDTNMLLFHQLSGEAAEKSANHKPSSHSAQEDKNFNNYFDFCFTVSQRDEEHRAWLVADKARAVETDATRIKLVGNKCMWVGANDPDYAPQEEFADNGIDEFEDDAAVNAAALRYLDPEAYND